MKVNSISYAPKSYSAKKVSTTPENFNGLSIINNKKALKGVTVAALLGMATVMGCKQPTTMPDPTVIEEPVETQTDKEETEEQEDITEDTDNIDNTDIQDKEEDIPEEAPPIEEEPIDGTEEITKEDTNTDIEDVEDIDDIDDIEDVEDVESTEEVEETPEITVTRTEQAKLFQDSTVKEMFNLLGLNTKTQKVDLIEGAYTPYSGDVIHVEYKISPTTKQVYDLIPEESTPDKLVYKNSIVYVSAPDNAYSYKSTFMKKENGDIIRKDSLAPGYYYKYSIVDDSIKIDTISSANNMTLYRETIYYQKGRNSSEIQESSYLGWTKYYTNASVTVAE